jgi:hypothetical protein
MIDFSQNLLRLCILAFSIQHRDPFTSLMLINVFLANENEYFIVCSPTVPLSPLFSQ